MECQASDSKKLFKVFDATKRKRTRKKHEADDTNSIATDDSTGGLQMNGRRVASAKASLQNTTTGQDDGNQDLNNRDRDSSPSMCRSPDNRTSRSPRRHHRIAREGISLALKAGLVSTPRSTSPQQDGDGGIECVPRDQDSFIYAFLEEAIKRDKKKHRHSRKREERHSRERDGSVTRDHRHRRRHRDEASYREHEKESKAKKEVLPSLNQAALFETFAKLCAQMNEKTAQYATTERVIRSQSHKSLQCEVLPKGNSYDVNQRPERLHSRAPSKDYISPTRTRSNDECHARRSRDHMCNERKDCSYCVPYDKDHLRYASRQNIFTKNDDDKYREYAVKANPTRSYIDGYYKSRPVNRCDYKDYDDRDRKYNDRRICDQKTSRSFDIHREVYDDDRTCRRTARSEGKDRNYDYRDKRYENRSGRDKYYEDKDARNYSNKDRRIKRNLEHFEKASIISRDDDYRERDKYSERERDSGLSVADGETSTISGRSNCLRVVKQEISEQREAMDKMMKLWKELMRCFKGISQAQGAGQGQSVSESAANVRESAAAQLRLWRECMRRYETVARDVGDTDARLMEEINKQRSEMTEMASMWQECLQRYRDMSNDFNSLKQQLATSSESPSRAAPPLVCAEGEGMPPLAPYRLPHATYLNAPTVTMSPPYAANNGLRAHASAPPAPPPWWWAERPPSPRRKSSPDSRASRDRRPRHKDRDRDDSRYKEKAKTGGARSDHRHRKR